MFAGKKSAQIREILISESTWEEMTCLFAPSITCVFCLLVVLHEKFIRKNEKIYSDYGGSLIVTLTGTAVLSVLYLTVTSHLHYDEHQLSDVYVVASDGNENL